MVVNPRENVSVITLRNGTEVETPVKVAPISSKEENEEYITTEKNAPTDTEITKRKFLPLSDYRPIPNFPQVLVGSRKYERDHDKLHEIFSKCKVNISLLNIIKQVSRYAKFFKPLCTSKRKQKLKGIERVKVGERVYAIIQEKLPAKCTDPGMCTISCMIGDTKFEKPMPDSGASINGMPYSVYTSLKLGPSNKMA